MTALLSVQSDLMQAIKKLRSLTEAQQMKFAAAKALTKTAIEAQAEVKKNMPSRFTIRRQWVIQGIRVERATKSNLTATVYSRDKFMGLQELGGPKSPLRNYIAVPTRAVRRTPKDMIKKAERPGALGDKVHVIDYKGHKWLALKDARKGAAGHLRLLYLLIPRAQVKNRLGLRADAMKVARSRFRENLRDALAEAVRTAR